MPDQSTVEYSILLVSYVIVLWIIVKLLLYMIKYRMVYKEIHTFNKISENIFN
jgi:hypothetical protein